MYPHRIRLRGPWEALQPDGSVTRVNLPVQWRQFSESILAGPKVLMRHFGLPRTLDADESVYLICEFDASIDVQLNGSNVVPDHSALNFMEWNITQLLRARNKLTILAPSSAKPDLPPEIALEIRGPVFLRDVAITEHGCNGQIVGENRPNMEVHLLAFGRAVAHVSVQVHEEFAFSFPRDLPPGHYNHQAPQWTVELIELANRWYCVDLTPTPFKAAD